MGFLVTAQAIVGIPLPQHTITERMEEVLGEINVTHSTTLHLLHHRTHTDCDEGELKAGAREADVVYLHPQRLHRELEIWGHERSFEQTSATPWSVRDISANEKDAASAFLTTFVNPVPPELDWRLVLCLSVG